MSGTKLPVQLPLSVSNLPVNWVAKAVLAWSVHTSFDTLFLALGVQNEAAIGVGRF